MRNPRGKQRRRYCVSGFAPHHCPHVDCPNHEEPADRFYRRHGSFRTDWNGTVPRFLCKVCRRTFSRQTFRHDYCDKKPYLNAEVFDRLIQSGGLRETAFRVGLTRNNLEAKVRKIARTLGHLHDNMMTEFPDGSTFQMDEMESFEDNRRTRPLTVPVLIESASFFLVATDCAPIRPKGRKTLEKMRQIRRDEARFGPRQNLSIPCLRGVLAQLAKRTKSLAGVHLRTDRKTVYRRLAREAFGPDRVRHRSYSSKTKRDTRNPLFRINLTNAMSRDYNGRLRRRTWLCSKQGKYLRLQLNLMAVFRNYIRPRTRRDAKTPAMHLGFCDDPLSFSQCLSWRQDWGDLSFRPDRAILLSFKASRVAA